MGDLLESTNTAARHMEVTSDASSTGCGELKVLCLHGWRTSGEILFMQTAAWRHHISANYTFLNAPIQAEGPPVEEISVFYPNRAYYEWTSRINPSAADESTRNALCYIAKYMNDHGPFDGLLGFSQGAAMVTRIAHCYQNQDPEFKDCCKSLKFLLLIGGVEPVGYYPSVSRKLLFYSRIIVYGVHASL